MQVRIAKLIGLFFLVAGTLDFLLWLIFLGNNNSVFDEIGLYIIISAIPLCFVGLALILLDSKSTKRRRTLATLAILINIPFCIGILWLYDEVGKRSLVTILNDSGKTIQELKITGKDYQDRTIEKVSEQIESSGKDYVVLNKWASHHFDLKIVLDDTTIQDKISYYRLFRAQPLFDTLVLKNDFQIEYKRGEEGLFRK